jgi:exopolysaccharide biosynthesis WecB/TagA/CpsF family protein
MLVTEHGCHQPEKYVDFAIRHRPSLIVLGMGMPKQEQVAIQLRSALDFPCLIICGGAIIDFLGGKVTRAPALLRRTGMEWVYRLAMEPRRLFYRYVVGNPLFLISSLRYANGVKSKGAG